MMKSIISNSTKGDEILTTAPNIVQALFLTNRVIVNSVYDKTKHLIHRMFSRI